jgi:hypothetical protein
MTDRIVVNIYVQGNGPETETYTDKETAYEIRIELRERFENINTMGLTELVAKFYDVVKIKGSKCPDEWFSDMLYLNEQIGKANGTRRSDAEIIAHITIYLQEFFVILVPDQFRIPVLYSCK